MSENTFHSFAQNLVEEEVNVITTRGDFNGRLISVGKDVILLQNRMGPQHLTLGIRIAEIVVLHRAELGPRGPFGFMPRGNEFVESAEAQNN
ncbi:DUF2642 domain-containing protein [Bacillus sp. BRMEA1]|uniref:DUF2642 domain-containing protein n=1 Tax=Neobacillus endophyticus TaxID=2738405 RepID=UPI001563BC55|nr:DUF2642 domain-containing protein [Neobacillus endophyticus]NRD79537.1 DUF2642 domain-containing protein [Neobacillus endophyticus]